MTNTDKQIIIEGCDVSYCPNHYNGWSALHRDHRPMCECGYDSECKPKDFECSHYVKCLEKQLKAKEQECEELNKTITNLENIRDEFSVKLDQLKEELEAYKMEAEEGKEINAELKAENEEWKKANDSILTTLNVLAKSNIKLRETLAEIKEIADEKAKVNDWLALEILEKINEVEE